MAELNIGDPVKVTIKKFDPSRDEQPYFKTYMVPYAKKMRVLEALDYIVEELGESLAYHWFCGVKKCGMCGVLVNSRPQLACWEPVQPEMVIEPLPHFPVVRDLVVDRGQYQKNLLAMDPEIERHQSYVGFPEPLLPGQMVGAAEMMHCIECMLCVSACPAYGESFVGPAPLVQLAKYALDPRDEGARAQTAVKVGGIEQCISCFQCTRVCPTSINVFRDAIEGLREQAREKNLIKPPSLRSRFFANIHTASKIGSAFAPLSNSVTQTKLFHSALEKFMGIDPKRPIPTFASVPFDRWFRNRKDKMVGARQVLLFHDTYATYMETDIAIAATEVLEAANYTVLIDEKRKCCGRPMLSKGMIEEARKNAIHNIEVLAQYARKGIPIIGLEPSCILTIRDDYPILVPGEAAEIVSANTYTFEEFITEVVLQENKEFVNKFTDKRVKLLLHGHCHAKTLVGVAPAMRALSLPPNYQVAEIPSGCCGMAGSFGFEKEHIDQSLSAGEEVLFPAIRKAGSDVEIVAAGVSCRQQIAIGTNRKARHPALVLRDALVKN